MADLSRTIEIVFAGVNNTGAALSTVGRGLEDLSDKAARVTAPLAAVGKTIIAMDAAAAGLAAVLGTKAVQETNKFADSIYLVQKQLGDQGPGIEQARADIEGLALQYGKNANDVAQSMAGFLAAGNDYANSAGLVETSTRLMIAGDLDAITATDAITRSLSGFRVPADQAAAGGEKVGDVLNKIGDISSGSFNEIVQGFARIAPTARDAGLSMEETASWVAVLVDKFGSGEIAATALKSGLLSLLDPSREGRQALQDLGVATTDASGNLRAGKDIMADLARATAGMTDAQRLQTTAVIFGKDQAGAMNALLGDWGTSQRYLAQMMDQTTGATGSMGREVAGKLELMSTTIARADEAWRQLLEHLGRQITAGGELQDLVESIGGLGSALRSALDAGVLDDLLVPLRARFAALADLVDGIARALPEALERVDWTPVLGALGDLEEGFRGLFGGLDLTKPEDLAVALQAVVDAAGSFIEVSQGLYRGLAPIFQVLGSLVQGFASLSPEVQSATGYFIGGATAVNLLSGPIGVLGKAVGALGSVWTTASAAISGGALLPALGQAGLVGAAGAAGYAVGTVLNDGLNKVVETATGTKGASLGTWLYDLTHANEDLAATAAPTAAEMAKAAELFPKVAEGAGSAEEQVARLTAAEDAQLLTAEDLTGQFNALSTQTLDTSGKLQDLTVKTEAQSDGVETLVYRNGRLVQMSPEIRAAMTAEADAAQRAKAATEAKAQEQERMNRASTEFLLGWEKIKAEAGTKIFEAKTKVDIAQIEADAKRTVAAFSSMSETFKSTETVLTSLFDLWGGLNSRADRNQVGQWIDREYRIREQLAQSQTALIDAEIRRMEAQTAMLERGGVELRITSDGLEPDLEAFMFRVIDKVRVRVAGSYQDFLLGCGG